MKNYFLLCSKKLVNLFLPILFALGIGFPLGVFMLFASFESFRSAFPNGGWLEYIIWFVNFSYYLGALLWPFAIGSNLIRIFLVQ